MEAYSGCEMSIWLTDGGEVVNLMHLLYATPKKHFFIPISGETFFYSYLWYSLICPKVLWKIKFFWYSSFTLFFHSCIPLISFISFLPFYVKTMKASFELWYTCHNGFGLKNKDGPNILKWQDIVIINISSCTSF